MKFSDLLRNVADMIDRVNDHQKRIDKMGGTIVNTLGDLERLTARVEVLESTVERRLPGGLAMSKIVVTKSDPGYLATED